MKLNEQITLYWKIEENEIELTEEAEKKKGAEPLAEGKALRAVF